MQRSIFGTELSIFRTKRFIGGMQRCVFGFQGFDSLVQPCIGILDGAKPTGDAAEHLPELFRERTNCTPTRRAVSNESMRYSGPAEAHRSRRQICQPVQRIRNRCSILSLLEVCKFSNGVNWSIKTQKYRRQPSRSRRALPAVQGMGMRVSPTCM